MREFRIEIRAHGLDEDAEDDLFNRVSDAAHSRGEQVECLSPPPGD